MSTVRSTSVDHVHPRTDSHHGPGPTVKRISVSKSPAPARVSRVTEAHVAPGTTVIRHDSRTAVRDSRTVIRDSHYHHHMVSGEGPARIPTTETAPLMTHDSLSGRNNYSTPHHQGSALIRKSTDRNSTGRTTEGH